MTTPGGAGQAHDAVVRKAYAASLDDATRAEDDAARATAAVARLRDKVIKFEAHAAAARDALPAAEAAAEEARQRLHDLRIQVNGD